MEAFDYAAIDTSGKRVAGTLTAMNAREARNVLRTRKLTPIDLTASKRERSSEFKTGKFQLEKRVTHKDRTQATRQLAILLDAATPVEEALKITALQFEKSPMRNVLLSTRAQVLEGAKLSEALRPQSDAFSDLYIAMVSSGETSGRLPVVMERLALDMEAAQKIRRKILGASIYPIVLSVVALAAVVLLMVLVVPMLVKQFETFDQDLPGLTQFVIALSAWLKSYGIVFLIVLCGIWVFIKYMLKRPAIRYAWHRQFLKLPILGRVSRDLNAARFARTMAGLMDSGTPALTAMETSKFTLKNVVMREAINDAIIKVREGSSMSSALRQTGVLPPLVVQMVAGGEASGDVGKMFSKSAEYLEDEFDSSTSIFLSLLEPVIIILMAGMILVIIAAIFLPILRLNTLPF